MGREKLPRVADADEALIYLTAVLRGENVAEMRMSADKEGKPLLRNNSNGSRKASDQRDRLRAAELFGKRYGLFSNKPVFNDEPVVIRWDVPEV